MVVYKLIILSVVLVAVMATWPTMVENDAAVKSVISNEENLRLPSTSFPTHYKLTLITSIAAGFTKYFASVEINLEVTQATDEIIIHSKDLEIIKCDFLQVLQDNTLVPIEIDYDYEPTKDFLIIKSKSQLELGKYSLEISFQGDLRLDNRGFYLSSFKKKNGDVSFMAATYFQATEARTAFPCYDEPHFKAQFSLKVTHEPFYKVLSNSKILSTTPSFPGYVETTFQETGLLSTYTIAFLIGELDAGIASGIHTIQARGDVISQTKFATEIVESLFNVIEKYLGVPYIDYMPKLDHVAVPDFEIGAMENWGMITYSERNLLFDQITSTFKQKIEVMMVISHESSHQWFGNLVTPAWWNYLWLNEGFATYLGFYEAHLHEPEFDFMDLFIIDQMHRVLIFDSLETTHQMSYDVNNPEEINGVFDAIAYAKAASVIRMFHHVIGDEDFKESLTKYLTKHKLNSVTPENLYDSFEEVLGKSVKDIMNSWELQSGYPVLFVERNYESNTINISQNRFYSKSNESGEIWFVPFDYVDSRDPDLVKSNWLSERTTLLHEDIPNLSWILFNYQQTGYYRVNYDTENWELLIKALKTTPEVIHRINRAQLIDDSFTLFKSGHLHLDIPLNLLTYLTEEHKDFIPWSAAGRVFEFMAMMLYETNYQTHFERFGLYLLENVYKDLVINDVNDDELMMHKYLKETITNWACKLGSSDCLSVTNTKLNKIIETGATIAPDISAAIYCNALISGGEKEFLYLMNKLVASDNQEHRFLIIDSIGCTRHLQSLKIFLHSSIALDNTYTVIERRKIIKSSAEGNMIGFELTLLFLRNNYRLVVRAIGGDATRSLIIDLSSKITTKSQIALLDEIIEQTDFEGESIRKIAEENIAWAESESNKEMGEWIQQFIEQIYPTTTLGPIVTTENGFAMRILIPVPLILASLVYTILC